MCFIEKAKSHICISVQKCFMFLSWFFFLIHLFWNVLHSNELPHSVFWLHTTMKKYSIRLMNWIERMKMVSRFCSIYKRSIQVNCKHLVLMSAKGPGRSAPVGDPLLRQSRRRFTDWTAPHVIKAQLPHRAPRVEPTTHVYVFYLSWWFGFLVR